MKHLFISNHVPCPCDGGEETVASDNEVAGSICVG